MSVGDVISILSGGGGAIGIVFLALFVSGYVVPKSRVEEEKERSSKLEQALELERQRSDTFVLTSQVVKDVMISLRKELEK